MKFYKTLILSFLCLFPILLSGCENQNMSSLSMPQNFAVENGIISFELVEDAGFYSISINDKVFNVDVKYNSNIEIVDNIVKYNANKLFAFGNIYTIKVKARGSTMYDSHYTNAIEYLHYSDLNMARNVRISSNTLVWDAVKDASYYVVKSFCVTQNTTEEIISDVNSCELLQLFHGGVGEYQFYVKSIRIGVNASESIYSEVVNYTFLTKLETPSIQNIYQSGNDIIMKVDVSQSANKVTIYCNDDIRSIMLNSYFVLKNGTGYTINLTGVFGVNQFKELKGYVFTIQAKHETASSSYFTKSDISEQFVFNKSAKLETPNLNVSFDEEMNKYVATWTLVDNAIGYEIVIDNGTPIFVEKDQSKFVFDDYSSIKIRAVGVGNYITSDDSAIVEK